MNNPIALNKIDILQKIGDGSYGKVQKVKMDGYENPLALKIMDKNLLDDNALDAIYNELTIHRIIQHSNIVRY